MRKEKYSASGDDFFSAGDSSLRRGEGGGADLCDSFRFCGGDMAYGLTKIFFMLANIQCIHCHIAYIFQSEKMYYMITINFSEIRYIGMQDPHIY